MRLISGEDFVDNFSWFEAANDWLATQKIEDFKVRCTEYSIRVLSHIQAAGATSASPDPYSITLLKGRFLHQETYFHRPEAQCGSELI